MSTSTETIEELATREYKYGFVTDVEADTIPKGLSEDVVRIISQKKQEPEWLLEWRLKAYRLWLTMKEPSWQNVKYDPINYQDIVYYSAPKPKKVLNSLDEVDPEVKRTFDKLGIPIEEQKLLAGVAVHIVASVLCVIAPNLALLGTLRVLQGLGAAAAAVVAMAIVRDLFTGLAAAKLLSRLMLVMGAAPIPASSGQIVRYRLNRGGDRQLNRALHTITISRLRHDPTTRAYATRRTAEGKSAREIKRCLKRYLARHLFRLLDANPNLHPIPATTTP